MENQGQFDFDPEKFDFCVHRKKRNINRIKDLTLETPKKIKTLLPKTKATSTPENVLFTAMSSGIEIPPIVSTPTTSVADSGKCL